MQWTIQWTLHNSNCYNIFGIDPLSFLVGHRFLDRRICYGNSVCGTTLYKFFDWNDRNHSGFHFIFLNFFFKLFFILLVRQVEREYLEVSILFIASSGPKRFSVFHATRHGPLQYEAVLHWRIEFGFIH